MEDMIRRTILSIVICVLLNISGIMIMEACIPLPISKARWPASLPIDISRYQFWVVDASAFITLPIVTPISLAEVNPKVGIPSGRGRSLSIVLGTWIFRIFTWWAARYFVSRLAVEAVSSPPIVTSNSIPSFTNKAVVKSWSSGLKRLIFMAEPPRL